jgi:hypothetical protein
MITRFTAEGYDAFRGIEDVQNFFFLYMRTRTEDQSPVLYHAHIEKKKVLQAGGGVSPWAWGRAGLA